MINYVISFHFDGFAFILQILFSQIQILLLVMCSQVICIYFQVSIKFQNGKFII